MDRPLLREDKQSKNCRVYSYVYVKKQCVVLSMCKNKDVQTDE
jgi:hypothetical protein